MTSYYFGFSSLNYLDISLRNFSARKIFLVTGNHSYSQSGAESFLSPILKNYDVLKFSNFSTNTKYSESLAGLELCLNFQPDIFLAIGGGSVIDMAKLIRALLTNPSESLSVAKGDIPLSPPTIPLIAVPTTSGTGSEVTRFSVFYINDRKLSLAHPYILPTLSIIDPELTLTLSPSITASTGFDALCQGIESFWATSSTSETRSNSLAAIKLAWNNLSGAVNSPNRENREAMSKASLLAGLSLDITRSTLPHALCYVLTTDYGLSHGHAVAICLAPFFTLHTNKDLLNTLTPTQRDYLTSTMQDISQALGCNSVTDCVIRWRDLMHSCGLPSTFSDVGVTSEAAKSKILEAVNLTRSHLHPMPFTQESLKQIFSY